MEKKESKSDFVWWILAFFGIGGLVLFLVCHYLSDNSVRFTAIVSIMGTYITLFSLILMFSQFKSISDTSRETKRKMDSLFSISNLAKHAELARSAQQDVANLRDELAIYKIQLIKETLIRFEKTDDTVRSKISEYCGKLGTHLTGLRSNRHSLKRNVIVKDLEEISDFMLRQVESVKNNSN